MSQRIDFSKLRHAGKPTDKDGQRPELAKGCNTNIKRQPVRVFSDEEKAAWLKGLGL